MIPLKNVEQMRALVGDVFREALSENNTVLKKDISSTVTADVVHEMDFLLQAKERQQEEHFRRLDSLIRQQQATRKESAKGGAIMRLRKQRQRYHAPEKDLYIDVSAAPAVHFRRVPTAAAVHSQSVCTAASTQGARSRWGRSSALR